MKKCIMLMVAFGVVFLTMAGQVTAVEKAYVKDTFTITLRTGPTTGNKILAFVASGEQVEVMETEGDWSLVRLMGDDKEGWVLTRYLMDRLPWETKALQMRDEIDELKTKLPRLQNELAETRGREKALTRQFTEVHGQLKEMTEKYDTRRTGAATYLTLKKEYDENQFEMEEANKRMQGLIDENNLLKSSETHKWFLTGALVLLFGLIIGLVIGSREKKRRSNISF